MNGDVLLRRATSLGWRQYYELTKPRVVSLIVFTALVGMLLGAPEALPWTVLVFGLLGIGLAAASGAVINHIVDRKIDAVMKRTQGRPFPSGRVEAVPALLFAAMLALLAAALLLGFTNLLTTMLTFAAFVGYAFIYTVYLKRWTSQNIVWGGAAGAVPPLLGWVAMTGEISIESLLLFLIVFIWTPPHFWPLAIHRREEYQAAGIPMLPVTHGTDFTKFQILLYSVMLLAVSLLPYAVRMSGLVYLVGVVILGVGFLYYAVQLYRSADNRYAMPLFGYSIVYLFLLFALLLIDHYLQPLLFGVA